MSTNVGYRAIYKLETAADFKLLNDELKSLWIKIMGGLTSKDMASDTWGTLDNAEKQITTMSTRLSAIDQLNTEQNARIKVLEDYKTDTRIKALEDQQLDTRLKTLEEQKPGERITALETKQTELESRVAALETDYTTLNDKYTRLGETVAALSERVTALEGGSTT